MSATPYFKEKCRRYRNCDYRKISKLPHMLSCIHKTLKGKFMGEYQGMVDWMNFQIKVSLNLQNLREKFNILKRQKRIL